MPEITFGPLPAPARKPPKRYSSKHRRVAEQLRARPGEWAHVTTVSTVGAAASTAHAIRKGVIAAYEPAGSFEAHARTVDGERRVYARYVGPQQ